MDPSFLDSPQVAKQMAALNAASQARIAQNTRIAPSFHPPSVGTSSGPYLGGINSHSFSADLSPNRHANFQLPNSQTPNSATGVSFLDPSMSHQDSLRNPTNNQHSRRNAFFQGIATFMSKRNTPLPPSLTGIQVPNYDPTNSPYSIIEPGSELGFFRLAGKEIDLWRLYGTVFQNGGGTVVSNANLWPKLLPAFDLPERFPEMQANNSASVAVMLSQYYMAILHPFEEYYRNNLSEQAKKVQAGQQQQQLLQQQSQQQQQRVMPNKPFPPPSNVGRPVTAMPNMPQSGVRPSNTPGLMSQSIPPSNGMPQYPQIHPQNRPASSQNPHQQESNVSLGSSEIDPLAPTIDSNLLDQDVQGIKRKHEQEDRDLKRVRQKTDPPDGNTVLMSITPEEGGNLQSRQTSQPPSNLNASGAPRQQPSRRKIEYVPLAREAQTYGGRDIYQFDAEWNNIIARRGIRESNDWGIVDIECLCMSIRSRLSIEMSYALTTMAVLSTMRGNNPGSGFPLQQCPDLLDDTLDLLEELAFGEPEKASFSEPTDAPIITYRELVALVQDSQGRPFASLEKQQGLQDISAGIRQRPGDIIITIIGIIRNMSNLHDNAGFIANFPRLLDMVLRVCMISGSPPSPASKNLSLSDLLTIRKDVLAIFSNIAGHITLPNNTSPVTLRIARRTFGLFASFLVDPNDCAPPLASVQVAGLPPNPNRRPSVLADTALDIFTRFSHPDHNRQVLSKAIPSAHLWDLLTSLVYRLPVVDADFVFMQRSEHWLSFIEKSVMAIYSVVFLSPYELKQKIKSDRSLGLKDVLFRLARQVLTFPADPHNAYLSSPRRAIETMKLLDKSEDLADNSEPTMPALSFGMGFSDGNDAGLEKGTGILGANRDAAYDLLIMRDVVGDEVLFSELESMVRIEYQ
ncbi:SWI/SNF chromatin-remodeling complex subunit sol1 [Psilocybe cubensis]|uniref:ARID domain-containing protein n=2 Tax=Psilocybe cubensis TaxID=181762 RepID=A0A8H7YAA0_PSICU|nr:SWI/SNF chromatin-remodeling complex subunit sol1 [Psilocybe cubensis]KAH9486785.1 SWI/SNF chromatin-remodeling complex subunit sol1 [Psilocybe cubensis]